jgi:DNA-binding response OmpR family regulator
METPARILAVDDEPRILEIIKAYLEKEGFRVMTAANGKDALACFDLFPPDVVLLDLMLPDISGEGVCKKIRAKSKTPIIMLTAKADEESIVAGLNMGADDYITKPFSPRQLTARVKAALRRGGYGGNLSGRIASGNLTLDTANRYAEIAGEKIQLTVNEYKLLELFMTNPSKIFSREEIIEKIKEADFDGFDRAIDTHIKNLRQKIGDKPKESRFIETVYGMGYRFAGNIND